MNLPYILSGLAGLVALASLTMLLIMYIKMKKLGKLSRPILAWWLAVTTGWAISIGCYLHWNWMVSSIPTDPVNNNWLYVAVAFSIASIVVTILAIIKTTIEFHNRRGWPQVS